MPTYAIGDIQGCFTQFQALLDQIHFDPKQDILWFTGDLVNRGPHSLEVLRFIKALGDQHITILGNHDLHLIAVAYGTQSIRTSDSFSDILSAPDKTELIDWLRKRPLLHHDKTTNYCMTHAGIAPFWHVQEAESLAHEVETILSGDSPLLFLENMYGNLPDNWDNLLSGVERLRCITNYLTRMRFCYADGRLNLTYKGQVSDHPPELIPWFDVPNRKNKEVKIVFGHWAALGGKTDARNLFALDTGCVWGNCLTAMRLEDEKLFSVPCSK